MKESVNSLAVLLDSEKNLREEIETKRKAFEDSNAGLFEKYSTVKSEIVDSKEKIGIEAKEEFLKNGEKTLYGGIGIRVMSKLVYDESIAFGWAKEHSLCLKLDAKAFDKIAKSQDIGFVSKDENVVVTFPAEIKTEVD